jgi:hypothetical protein
VLDGVVLLWFVLTAMAVLFVAIDIRTTPESPVLKWAFVLVTGYTGVFGAFLYVLGCREPLPGLHEQYTSSRWRQALGSTMHCVAGDGAGILIGAVLAAALQLSGWREVILEYVLGFGIGWTIFQALFMRDMVGGSYPRSLRSTFIPELLSMNLLMTGMVPTMMLLKMHLGNASPATAVFWFVMSVALLVGSILSYPINWWLVTYHLKHGMMTLRPAAVVGHVHGAPAAVPAPSPEMQRMDTGRQSIPRPPVPVMTIFSFAALGAGLVIAWMFGSM